MSQFQDRKKAFEKAFSHDADLRFRAQVQAIGLVSDKVVEITSPPVDKESTVSTLRTAFFKSGVDGLKLALTDLLASSVTTVNVDDELIDQILGNALTQATLSNT